MLTVEAFTSLVPKKPEFAIHVMQVFSQRLKLANEILNLFRTCCADPVFRNSSGTYCQHVVYLHGLTETFQRVFPHGNGIDQIFDFGDQSVRNQNLTILSGGT